MSESWRRRAARIVALACVCALVGAATTVGVAAAKPGNGRGRAAAEPGWPESHLPQNDPKPGDAGYVEDTAPVAVPPEGMTDAELMLADPAGYAQMKAQRDSIERSLLTQARTHLKSAGVTPAGEDPLDAIELVRAEAALADAPISPYGYLRFTLVPSTTVHSRNGYLGTLYYIYGRYIAAVDSYDWSTVSWPGRSGNNIPGDQSIVGVGPLPEYSYDFGFMEGAFRGYEADARDEFYPGKWRLDPWTGAPYGRSCFELHGGMNEHKYAATSGCIRVYPSTIISFKTYYTYLMANKTVPGSARLHVVY